MIRVVLAGASGRMGQVVLAGLAPVGDIALTGTLGRGDDAQALLRPDQADVLVDFSVAEASRRLGPLAAAAGLSPVIGTSGLEQADVEQLAQACRKGGVGGLLVPNFSLGAVLQMRLAEQAARLLPCEAVTETHHEGKRDLPSGTARATARRLSAVGSREVPIHSERRAGARARQEVRFATPHELLHLTHEVSDRRAYLPGLLLAIRSVQALPGLVVGLEPLVFPRDTS